MPIPAMQALQASKTATGGAGTATVVYADTASDNGGGPGYTFSGMDIGAADAGRTVVVAIASRTTTARTIDSVTIAGVTATALAVAHETYTFTTTAALYAAAVPTGTTGTVVVTFSDTMSRCSVSTWACTGISTTPNDTATSQTPATPVGVDVTANGALMAVCVKNTGDTGYSWTNLTEDFDAEVGTEGSTSYSGASETFGSAQTVSVSCTPPATGSDIATVYVGW